MHTFHDSGRLSGRGLRYAVSLYLWDAGRPLLVREIVAGLEDAGEVIAGRAGKTVSDALRWEVSRGRVVRVGRGRYARGRIGRSTQRFMRTWLLQSNAKSLVAETLHDEGGTNVVDEAKDPPLAVTADGYIDLDAMGY